MAFPFWNQKVQRLPELVFQKLLMNPLQNRSFGMVWFDRIYELVVNLLTCERNATVDFFDFGHEAFRTQEVNTATDALEMFDVVAN